LKPRGWPILQPYSNVRRPGLKPTGALLTANLSSWGHDNGASEI
jgi:hypothetical protein